MILVLNLKNEVKMKKNLFIVFIMLFTCAMFAQTITINSIGMHKDGEPGNFDVSTGDVVKLM